MRRVIVCKIGGALIDDTQAASQFIRVLAQYQRDRHVHIVVVHGGGSTVERLLKQLGLNSDKKSGLRITPDDHMPYVVGALAGSTNKRLCSLAYAQQIAVVGLSLFDGNSIQTAPMDAALGAVGKPTPNDSSLLHDLLKRNYLPIISSIGCGADGRLYNVNADHAATAVAQLLNAELLFLSDVDGVKDQAGNVIDSLSAELARDLINDSTINAGMLVKVQAAQQAAQALKQPVTIGSWTNTAGLQQRIADEHSTGFGTQVLPSRKEP